ncbi:Uncharacterized protein PECH_002632 [Penicillium ucsense]|uniref:Yeast cell wall synthesis Kre9/Knh1-like N-terminal domain-containing protein n=1 Tax=Penicillium ucsense TaxID=2839758 RepID=A0A8J8W8P4_9EURO|nr:Uncharacterized protein PECM_000266 [Penicillium ucsense]KAF7730607.1 Uncharacterized protein PECH_002632 [Penicillium ucsense]
MMRSAIPLILSLGSLAAAINITSPTVNTTVTAGSTLDVHWTSVDTDPSHFSLYLWNFVSWPPTYVPLAMDVSSSDLSASVKIPCDTNPEWGYQISGINGTNVYIIYAQGEKFSVEAPKKPCVDATPVPTASTCPSAPASTVYVTVSPTASTTHRHHHHSSHVHPAPSSSTTSLPISKTVKPGIVPKTIGWCSDYSNPVTLSEVPHPTASVVEVITAAPSQITDAPRVKTIVTTKTKVVCPCDE